MTTIICLIIAAAIILIVVVVKMSQLKAEYLTQALRLTSHDLDAEILRLWMVTGEKVSFKDSIKLHIFEKESMRREFLSQKAK